MSKRCVCVWDFFYRPVRQEATPSPSPPLLPPHTKQQQVNVEWTIRKLKPKLSQLLGSDGTVPADDLVLVSASRGVLSDNLTVEEAGLCDGTATVLTRAQHAAAASASASANQQRGQSPSRATTATATAAPAPLASSLKKHDSVATAQRKKARVSSGSPAAASSSPHVAFKVRVAVTVSASGDVVLKGLTPKHTFGRLVKLLSTHTGVPASHLTLLFNNVPMADTDTLGSAGLTRDGHELVLVRQHREEAAPARPRGDEGAAPVAGTRPADRRSALDADDTPASSPAASTVAGPSARMSVTLETPAGDVRQVFVRPSDVVRTVQVLAGDNWGVPADGVVVNVGGMPLHPRQTLAHAGVRAGARLLVTLNAPQGQLTPCAHCGLPKSTPFCTVTGLRHDADADADAADDAAVFNPQASSSVGRGEDAAGVVSRRRGDGLPVPMSADPFVTISVLSQADGKEYRLPSMRPASVTVRRVKELLARNTGTEPVDMALRSGRDGTLLADNRTLAQAGIENGETLVLHEAAAGRPRPPPPVPLSSARALEPHTLGLGRTYPTLSPPKIFPLAGGDPDTHPLYDPRFESGVARDAVRTQLSYEDAGGPRGRASAAEDHPPAYDHIPPAHLPPRRPPPPPQAFGHPAHSWLPEPGESAAASALAAQRVKELLEENRLLGEEVGLLRDKSAAVENEARTQIDDLVEENEQLQAAVREREREERYLREDLQREREHARRRASVSASDRGGGGDGASRAPPSERGGGPSRSNPGERVGSTTYDRHGRVVTRTSSRPASSSHLPPHPASGFSSSQQQPTNIVHHVVSGPPPPPPPHPAFPAPHAVSGRPSTGVAATDPVWGLTSVRASPAPPAWLGRRASQREEEEAEAAAAAAARRRRRREAEWAEEEEEDERRRREREARWEDERRREREADANVDRALASISGGSAAAAAGGEGEGTAPPRIRVSAVCYLCLYCFLIPSCRNAHHNSPHPSRRSPCSSCTRRT